GTGRDANEEVAVAQVLIGEADLLRSEEQRGPAAGAKMLTKRGRTGFEALKGFAGCAAAAVGGTEDQRAVRDGLGDGCVLLGGGKDGLGVDSRAGFAEGEVVG